MKRTVILLGVVALLATAGIALGRSAADHAVEWRVIAGGGGRSTSTGYRVNGTAGQALAGPPPMSSSSYRIGSGFWAGVPGAIEIEHRIYLPLVLRG